MSCVLPFLEFWMSIDLSVNISLRTFLDFFSEGCMENDKMLFQFQVNKTMYEIF